LGYKVGRACVGVLAPEFRIFQLLRGSYGATRQMRALDFGVVPEEGRRRKKRVEQGDAAAATPERIDEAAFNDLYNQVVQGRPAAAAAKKTPQVVQPVPGPAAEVLEALPEDAILGAAEEAAPPPVAWKEPPPPPAPRADETPIDFKEALRLLEGVSDRNAIAHIVLRASRSKAARALLLQVQGGVVLGWDGLGEGLEDASRLVAIPLAAPSAFQLVVNTRSHFLGPLQK